jgi:hypothetical protein
MGKRFPMLGRRKFLGGVGATAVALSAVSASAQHVGLDKAPTPTAGDEAGGGVDPKGHFGNCKVLGLESTEDGAVSVRLADSAGQPFEIELLGYDPRTPGVARAGSLGVYMNNRGRGTAATIEEHGLAAMALARHLARSEAAGARLPVLPNLSERSRAATTEASRLQDAVSLLGRQLTSAS